MGTPQGTLHTRMRKPGATCWTLLPDTAISNIASSDEGTRTHASEDREGAHTVAVFGHTSSGTQGGFDIEINYAAITHNPNTHALTPYVVKSPSVMVCSTPVVTLVKGSK
ncbi:hypothetical protein C8F04DRAFT_1174276 [Mycena alexandri]|uniref:Uncharacterized protein n=1 Tax=Mycena alexandri TaxID=1745969 RepID=A0AAD6TFX6_9AGAR|nr:hypothetical protein C8F04DRAFT_1174276 [Mycena alexandri]